MVAEGMRATGLPRERVALALEEGPGLDFYAFPDPSEVTEGYASEVYRDECGCCGSATIFLVGPAGRFPVGGQSGAL